MRTGLEPATPGVTGRYSNQLNYRTNCSVIYVFLERGCKGTQKIGTSKFFAHFFTLFYVFSLFDLDNLRLVLHPWLLSFFDSDLQNTVTYVSLNAFLVDVVWKEQSLTEF